MYIDYCTATGVIKKLCFWGSSCFNIQQAHSLIISLYCKVSILFELEVLTATKNLSIMEYLLQNNPGT